jgi:hypothetical protein
MLPTSDADAEDVWLWTSIVTTTLRYALALMSSGWRKTLRAVSAWPRLDRCLFCNAPISRQLSPYEREDREDRDAALHGYCSDEHAADDQSWRAI